jgi:hypothetical protein
MYTSAMLYRRLTCILSNKLPGLFSDAFVQ